MYSGFGGSNGPHGDILMNAFRRRLFLQFPASRRSFYCHLLLDIFLRDTVSCVHHDFLEGRTSCFFASALIQPWVVTGSLWHKQSAFMEIVNLRMPTINRYRPYSQRLRKTGHCADLVRFCQCSRDYATCGLIFGTGDTKHSQVSKRH